MMPRWVPSSVGALSVALLLCAASVGVSADAQCHIDMACAEIYAPVCGSDGVTYSNACEFNRASVCGLNGGLTSTDGECARNFECPAMCPLMYAPMCGSDGNTYGNLCALISSRCAASRNGASLHDLVRVKHAGECGAIMCPSAFDPVCADNGETFSNECEMTRAARDRGLSLKVARKGECAIADDDADECETMCTDMIDPVCGTNGVTYMNECKLQTERCRERSAFLKVAFKGACKEMCDSACLASYTPLCASTGRTFSSLCDFIQSTLCNNDDVSNDDDVSHIDVITPVIVSSGECPFDGPITIDPIGPIEQDDTPIGPIDPATCPTKCDKSLRPICGTDGKTYPNECLLSLLVCRGRTTATKKHDGPCDVTSDDDDVSDDDTDPCAVVMCPMNSVCVPERQECFAPPCDQFKCVPLADDVVVADAEGEATNESGPSADDVVMWALVAAGVVGFVAAVGVIAIRARGARSADAAGAEPLLAESSA